MPAGLSKDIVLLFAGIFLSFALESERAILTKVISPDLLSFLCLGVFAVLTGGFLAFRHYHNLLSAGDPLSQRRIAYEHLRSSLAEGGNPARIYARWLEKALRTVEHWFGEKIPERRPFVQHAIGLEKPAALWTTPSLDRCVLFAFIYPQALLILGWVMSGKAGPAEIVLGLADQPDPMPRYATAIAFLIAALGYAKCCEILGGKGPPSQEPAAIRISRFALWSALIVAGALMIDHWLNHGKSAISGSVILASSVVGAIAGDVLLAFAAGIVGVVIGIGTMQSLGLFGAALVASVACLLVGFLQSRFGNRDSWWWRIRNRLRYEPAFWIVFLAGMILLNIALGRLLAGSSAWPVIGPLLLFYGLLPALNAPFLWFSIGMTRALLWLGLQRKAWWPYFYGLWDAAISILVIVVLIGVIVVGVQALDLAAEKGGAGPILPIAPLLDSVIVGFTTKSFKAEYWWIYTLLLSAMIPSLLNLAVGGFSLMRGIPFLSRYLHSRMPEGKPVENRERGGLSLILSIQLITGMCLGVASQFILLPWWIFGYVLPGLGFGVFKLAQTIEAFNLPSRIWPI